MRKAGIIVGLFVAVQYAGAVMLVSESFDNAAAKKYAAGEKITASGIGASKGWSVWAAKGGELIEVKAPGLNSKDGQCLILGGSADENKGTAQIFTLPDAPVSFSGEGVYYISFLFKNMDASKVSSDFSQLALKQGEGNLPLMAAGINSEEKVMGVAGKTQLAGSSMIENGTVYRFVAKVICKASGSDQVSVCAFSTDSVPVQEPSNWDVETSAEVAGLADKLLLMVSFGNSKVMYDDLKIGTEYRDVIGSE